MSCASDRLVLVAAASLAAACGTGFEQDYSVPEGTFEWVGPFPHAETGGPAAPAVEAKPLLDRSPDSMLVVDADGDGIDDLLWCADSVGIVLGSKSGTFTPYEVPANPDYAPFTFGSGCAVTGWQDKTGKQRSVAAAFASGLSLSFPMHGNLPNAPLVLFPLPDASGGMWKAKGDVFVADIDGDEEGEVVRLGIRLPDDGSSKVALLVWKSLGNGQLVDAGVWELPAGQAELCGMTGGSIPPLVFAGELDGKDGVDFAAEGGLVILGADKAPVLLELGSAGQAPPLFADLDGDEVAEVVTVDDTTCTVSALDGGTQTALGTFACPGDEPGSVFAADVDHDGKHEIAEVDGKLVTVYRVGPSGEATAIAATQTDYEMVMSGSLDWDGKGWDELVMTSINSVFLCSLSTEVGTPGACTPHPTFSGYVIGLATPDIDRDGKRDFVGLRDDDINLPPRLQVLLAKDSFGSEPPFELQFPHLNLASQEQLFLQFADLSGDPSLDMLIGSKMVSQGPEFIIPLDDGSLPALARMQRNDAPVAPGTSLTGGISLFDLDGDGSPEALFEDGAWTRLPAPGEPSFGPGVPAGNCPSGRLTLVGPIVAEAKDLLAVGDGHEVRLVMYSNIAGECQDLDEADPGDEIRDMLLAPDGRVVVLGARSPRGSAGNSAVSGIISAVSFTLVENGEDGDIQHTVKELFTFACNPDRFTPLGLTGKPEDGYVVSCLDGGGSGHLLRVPPAPALPAPLALAPIMGPDSLSSGDLDGNGTRDIILAHGKGVLLVSVPQTR
jgi:hypothetical protein